MNSVILFKLIQNDTTWRMVYRMFFHAVAILCPVFFANKNLKNVKTFPPKPTFFSSPGAHH